jgi:hypothetical protein
MKNKIINYSPLFIVPLSFYAYAKNKKFETKKVGKYVLFGIGLGVVGFYANLFAGWDSDKTPLERLFVPKPNTQNKNQEEGKFNPNKI